MQIDIYYSYACRDTYLVFAWLKRVQQSGVLLDLNWHPFAIQMEDGPEYWQQPWETANSELRGFIAAEAARRQGNEAFLRFHDALEQAVHEQLLELFYESQLPTDSDFSPRENPIQSPSNRSGVGGPVYS